MPNDRMRMAATAAAEPQAKPRRALRRRPHPSASPWARPALLLAAFLMTCAGERAALAQTPEASPCRSFAWPLADEQAAFARPDLPVRAAGSELAAEPFAAVLDLQPAEQLKLPVAPERAPKPETFATFVRIPALARPGRYQVTLSDEAWIDVSQDGTSTLKSVAHTGQKGCPGVRKSVRFDLEAKPALIQVTGATARSIKLSLRAAKD